MGAHNRITEEKYNKIKKYSEKLGSSGMSITEIDKKISRQFSCGATTARNIRNTSDYKAYCERVFRFHGNPNRKLEHKGEDTAEQLDDAKYIQRASMALAATVCMLLLVVIGLFLALWSSLK